jgi:hypothetical protein
MAWHFTTAFERIRSRAKRSCESTIFFDFLFLFVAKLMELPKASETLLATEVGRLKTKFDTCRALHFTSLGAVGRSADTANWRVGEFIRFFYHLKVF